MSVQASEWASASAWTGVVTLASLLWAVRLHVRWPDLKVPHSNISMQPDLRYDCLVGPEAQGREKTHRPVSWWALHVTWLARFVV